MKSAISFVGKILRLPFGEKWLAIKSSILVIVVRIALRWVKLERVLRWLDAGLDKSYRRQESPDMARVKRTIWIINRISSFLLPAGPCLTNALVTRRFLSKLGYATKLRIGVRLDDARALEAHAWLERNGRIVTGWLPDLSDFSELPLE